MTLANHALGSGRNCNAGRLPRGLLSIPTSHAEMGEMNTPAASPAITMASTTGRDRLPLASQITAQVSSNKPEVTSIMSASGPVRH